VRTLDSVDLARVMLLGPPTASLQGDRMMKKNLTPWGTAVMAALSLVIGGCSHESEAKDTKGTTQFELRAPANQTITQGTTNQVRVSVDRLEYSGEISVSLDNLPSGISILNAGPIPVGRDYVDLTLEAKPDAPVLDNKVCTVRAKGGGAETTQQFKVSVRAK
jgi:hypothetical protein